MRTQRSVVFSRGVGGGANRRRRLLYGIVWAGAGLLLPTCSPVCALVINPTFVNGAGQLWTTSEETVVDEAIQSWTSRILDNQTVNVTLDFTNAGTGSSTYLGEAVTSFSETAGTNIYPWTPGVTQVIHINADAMTTGVGGDMLAFIDQSATVPSNEFDALSILRHEMGHMMGFTDQIYYNNFDTPSQVDKYASHVTISGTSAIFDAGGLNIPLDSSTDIVHTSPSGITAGDLMNPALPNGTRRDISQIDLNVLHLAYGYQIAESLTWDAAQTGAGSDGTGDWSTSATNWSTGTAASSWTNGDVATIGHGGTAGVITITSTGISAGGITFDAVSATSPGQYTIAGTSTDSLTLVGSGTMTMNANGTISAPMVGSGGLTVAGTQNLTISGVNTYTGATSVNSGTLTLVTGAQITSSSGLSIAAGAAVAMNSTGVSDGITINYTAGNSPNATIRNEIITGYNGGAWNGTSTTGGVINSAAAAGSGGKYAIGYADGADGVVSGLGSTQEKVMLTLAGDATLAGTVNLSDFGVLRANFGKTSGAQWDQGDFNYDGQVNLADFGILRANFGQSLSPGLLPAVGNSVATPEPAEMLLAAEALALLVLRPRHRIISNLSRRGFGY